MIAIVITPFSWGSDFFLNPDKSCESLNKAGIATGGWKPSKAFPGEWLCMSQLKPFGRVGPNGLENNIAFYVNGTNPASANDIRIKINVNNPKEKELAFSKLINTTKLLFKSHSVAMPKELSSALESNQLGSWQAPWGSAELILEGGRMQSFKVVLTNKKHLLKVEEARTASASDFERCKSAVSKAAGYSASLISGDGSPIQESGYKSFMLTGKGKDLFFCEVHRNNKYKINAALNGKFPFRYIAQGSL